MENGVNVNYDQYKKHMLGKFSDVVCSSLPYNMIRLRKVGKRSWVFGGCLKTEGSLENFETLRRRTNSFETFRKL